MELRPIKLLPCLDSTHPPRGGDVSGATNLGTFAQDCTVPRNEMERRKSQPVRMGRSTNQVSTSTHSPIDHTCAVTDAVASLHILHLQLRNFWKLKSATSEYLSTRCPHYWCGR